MIITLSYHGRLPAKQKGVSPVKAQLRTAFHGQIKAQVEPLLGQDRKHVSTWLDGHLFISPAHKSFRTAIELDVLMLVPPTRRKVGDVDNRLKTLIDGLTRPANGQQLKDHLEPEGGAGTFCLMDDDALVTRLSLDSRVWHDPSADPHDALVIVTAKVVLGDNADMSSPFGNMFLVL